MKSVTLHEGDSRIILRQMAERGEFVDSVVTDPPYGLVSVTKRFGKDGSKAARHGKDGAFTRASRGFMGKVWDGTAIERDPEFWGLVYDVMLPGAYVVAFSSARTYHHMAVAMELAGFITHPMIGWTFASGFPKAHNAARAIDKVHGDVGGTIDGVYFPVSDNAALWNGWHYGGQVRKPALEPIYVGQKPFSEKNGALNILRHGVGAVNVDDCRVPSEGGQHRENEPSQDRNYRGKGSTDFGLQPGPRGGNPAGRWPANLIHDGSEEVVALFPNSKGAMAPVRGDELSMPTNEIYGQFAGRVPGQFYGDQEGSAARFFESYPFEKRPIFHYPKASKKDRAGSHHPTVKPIALMSALIRHVTPPGGLTLDPFAGSGTTGQAAINEKMRAILIEAEQEYATDIRRRFGFSTPCAFEELLGESTYSDQFADLLG